MNEWGEVGRWGRGRVARGGGDEIGWLGEGRGGEEREGEGEEREEVGEKKMEGKKEWEWVMRDEDEWWGVEMSDEGERIVDTRIKL